jgi:hypothetical protein
VILTYPGLGVSLAPVVVLLVAQEFAFAHEAEFGFGLDEGYARVLVFVFASRQRAV